MSATREIQAAVNDLVEAAEHMLKVTGIVQGHAVQDAYEGLDASLQHYRAVCAEHLDSEGAGGKRNTSINAAKLLPRGLRRTVFDAILARYEMTRGADGLTCQQVEAQLRKGHATVSSIVNRLQLVGLIEPSGQYRSTQAKDPRYKAIVWRPTAHALELRSMERWGS